jgi:hypothetical protein
MIGVLRYKFTEVSEDHYLNLEGVRYVKDVTSKEETGSP